MHALRLLSADKRRMFKVAKKGKVAFGHNNVMGEEKVSKKHTYCFEVSEHMKKNCHNIFNRTSPQKV